MANRFDDQDGYTAKPITHDDFQIWRFGEVNTNDLFWLKDIRSDNNHAWRKLSESSAEDTKTGERRTFKNMLDIYQRL